MPDGEDVLIDVKADRAAALAQRLGMYRLRAKVAIEPTDLAVVVGLRRAAGGRASPIRGTRSSAGGPAWPTRRRARRHGAARRRRRCRRGGSRSGCRRPGVELVPDDSYILEMGFERLNGVDFRKGCYVGQEVTARMKHKTELRKGLARVRVEGAAAAAGHRDPRRRARWPGTLLSVADGPGLAYLRFDRADGRAHAGEARITSTRRRARETHR